jgi:hypothetical protein
MWIELETPRIDSSLFQVGNRILNEQQNHGGTWCSVTSQKKTTDDAIALFLIRRCNRRHYNATTKVRATIWQKQSMSY